jgi:hypothetical protein
MRGPPAPGASRAASREAGDGGRVERDRGLIEEQDGAADHGEPGEAQARGLAGERVAAGAVPQAAQVEVVEHRIVQGCA